MKCLQLADSHWEVLVVIKASVLCLLGILLVKIRQVLEHLRDALGCNQLLVTHLILFESIEELGQLIDCSGYGICLFLRLVVKTESLCKRVVDQPEIASAWVVGRAHTIKIVVTHLSKDDCQGMIILDIQVVVGSGHFIEIAPVVIRKLIEEDCQIDSVCSRVIVSVIHLVRLRMVFEADMLVDFFDITDGNG